MVLDFSTMEFLRNKAYPVISIICFVSGLVLASGVLLWKIHRRPLGRRPLGIDDMGNVSRIQNFRALRNQHETASDLLELVDKDGAGTWPPKTNHDSWPMVLRAYKDIYLELVPLLPAAEVSLDDNVNNERRHHYRSLMRKLLIERINIAEVEKIMTAAESENWKVISRDAYNGYYACVAVCRHAYRWATIPVVKVAQLEKIVEFPPELDAPWPYLQRHFGVTAESGNNTSNVLHNFNEKGERIYKINVGMSDLITSSEEIFFRMFYNIEVLAFPLYYEMMHAVYCFEKNDKASCVKHLENITYRLRNLLLIFYENLTESRVSHSVWLSYIQGFQGWGIGKMIDGEFVKYDGLSGNHVLFFQVLDAFLGMDRYLTDENMIRYIPVNQRKLCLAFKKHSFRNKKQEDTRIDDKFEKIVKHLKVFRAAHQARVMSYLQQPAPERLIMTAGKSVLEGSTAEETIEALEALDQMLVTRLNETI